MPQGQMRKAICISQCACPKTQVDANKGKVLFNLPNGRHICKHVLTWLTTVDEKLCSTFDYERAKQTYDKFKLKNDQENKQKRYLPDERQIL